MSQPCARSCRQIRERRLGAGQDHEIGIAGQRLAGRHDLKLHVGLGGERIEIVEVGDPGKPEHGDLDRAMRRRREILKAENILGRQALGVIEPRHHAVAAHPGAGGDDRMRVVEQRRIAPELVDQIALEPRPLGRLEQRVRADQRRDHAALVDVADQHDRQVGRLGEAHVGDVVRAQVDLRRAAGALGQDQIRVSAQLRRSSRARAASS